MKLERNNKYNKWKSLGLAVILASGIILSGCNNIESEVVLPTPTKVVEVTPTITPTVEPTITPTATPMPELSYEEEIALLGIRNPNKIEELQCVDVFEYTINGQRKIMFALINAYPNENGGHDVYEWFTDTSEVMFLLNYDIYEEGRYSDNYDCEDITIVSTVLDGATIERGYSLLYLPEKFKETEIMLADSEYTALLQSRTLAQIKNFLSQKNTNLEIADMYLALVPKQYRVTAAELDPNNLVEEGKVLVK